MFGVNAEHVKCNETYNGDKNMEKNDDKEYIDSLFQEALFMAEIYGIPKVLVYDYYEAFVEFVREELNKRIKTGVPTTKINTEIFFQVLMAEANVG